MRIFWGFDPQYNVGFLGMLDVIKRTVCGFYMGEQKMIFGEFFRVSIFKLRKPFTYCNLLFSGIS